MNEPARLRELLDTTVPRVADPGDWGAVVARAAAEQPARAIWRWLAPTLGVGTLVAVLAVLLVVARDSRDSMPARPVETIPKPTEPQPTEGERLFSESGCFSCHSVGAQGATGPGQDLTNEGAKARGIEWHVDHLRDPRSRVPGSTMPAFDGLSDEQLTQLATYLEGLGKAKTMYGALRQPQTDNDRRMASKAFGSNIDPMSLRIATRFEGWTLAVAESASDAAVCVVTVLDGTIEAGGFTNPPFCHPIPGIGPPSLARPLFPHASGIELENGRWINYVLVPDSVRRTRVNGRDVAIVNNIAVTTSGRPQTIEQLTPDGWWPPPGPKLASPDAYSVLQGQAQPGRDLQLTVHPDGIPLAPSVWKVAVPASADKLWVGRDPDRDFMCLYRPPDQAGCVSPESASAHSGVYIFDPATDTDAFDGSNRDPNWYWSRAFAGIVPDGYDTAQVGSRSVQVSDNVFLLSDPPPAVSSVIVRGPAGELRLRPPW